MLIDLFARHFIFISRIVFLLFFVGYIGFSLIDPVYARLLNLTVQLIVSIFIMYNFMSTNRKPFVITPYYADVIFFAGAILFINLLSNGIALIYNDLRLMLGLTFLPEQPPIIESRFSDFPKA
jgi:uncharacterized membrane protein YhdT